ncbi:membrane protein insertase YidC [Elongatibacter sediminis]|uniref:Membrane protein insertase YidC n=1 Tax=Elongatibacter sediminis TaxID=3119006 RepID=A0AAW9RIN5_9GAMM
MANLRPVLLIGLLVLGGMLWVEWQKDYGPQFGAQQAAPEAPAATGSATVSADGLPSVPGGASDLPPPDAAPVVPGDEAASQTADGMSASRPASGTSPSPVVTVRTDVLAMEIDLVGGSVVSAQLLNYPVTLEQPENKVQLLRRAGPHLFIAQSGLLSERPAPNHTTTYQAEQREYVLADGADELRIPLSWTSGDGIRVTRTFVLRRGAYELAVHDQVENQSATPWTGSRYDQLQRSITDEDTERTYTNPGTYSFTGIAFYSPEDKFEKVAFDDVADDPFNKTFSGGWLSMIQHYFFAAWIPPADVTVAYSTQEIAPDGWPRYLARAVAPAQTIQPGARGEFVSRLYLGPKLQEELEEVAPGLEHTVNYGIFTVFSKPLFWLLSHIHALVGNWGWAIVLLTVLIKAAFFKLTEAQYRSMARMRKLQPRIEQLKERYGDDRQRMSQAMMELYKKEKVNPLGGCLPILVQIPIFIALYWVLLESVELRQAPFVGWIQNLSVRDPYFILPALNAGFMIATQRLTPMAGMDPLQRKMMNLMPVVFAVMFAFFPAGLVLYWATNAGLSLAQQLYITRKIAAADN